jgi:hypothetical protein
MNLLFLLWKGQDYFFSRVTDIPELFKPNLLNLIVIRPYGSEYVATVKFNPKDVPSDIYLSSFIKYSCIRRVIPTDLCICNERQVSVFVCKFFDDKTIEKYRQKVLKYKFAYELFPDDWFGHRFKPLL